MADPVHARAIRRAAEYVGGLDVLARRLNVSRSRLNLYAEGVEEAPVDVFLLVVDIVLEADMAKFTAPKAAQDAAADKPPSA